MIKRMIKKNLKKAKIKAVIFDVDGMMIKSDMYFSEYLARELKINYEKDILPFFQKEFQLCLIGKADLKQEIRKYLKKWKWKYSLEHLLHQWFVIKESNLDKRILAIIKKLQSKGIKCCLGTNQEKYRLEFLLHKMNFRNLFDAVFSSALIGFKKPQPQFFQYIYKSLNIQNKKDILFWDDKETNIKAALDFGFQAIHYKSFANFLNNLKKLNLL